EGPGAVALLAGDDARRLRRAGVDRGPVAARPHGPGSPASARRRDGEGPLPGGGDGPGAPRPPPDRRKRPDRVQVSGGVGRRAPVVGRGGGRGSGEEWRGAAAR